MAVVVFYEKPGCVNNTRQKQALIGAGHEVEALDIRAEAWTPERLRSFFAGRPVAQWFNRAAPLIKSGAVVPERMEAADALEAMCREPLLIRRPLMESQGRRMAGFEEAAVQAWLGLGPAARGDAPLTETCPRADTGPDHACPEPKPQPGP